MDQIDNTVKMMEGILENLKKVQGSKPTIMSYWFDKSLLDTQNSLIELAQQIINLNDPMKDFAP